MGKEFITDLYPSDLLKITEDHKCILYRRVKYCIWRMNSPLNTVEQFIVSPKNTAQEIALLNLMRTHVK